MPDTPTPQRIAHILSTLDPRWHALADNARDVLVDAVRRRLAQGLSACVRTRPLVTVRGAASPTPHVVEIYDVTSHELHGQREWFITVTGDVVTNDIPAAQLPALPKKEGAR